MIRLHFDIDVNVIREVIDEKLILHVKVLCVSEEMKLWLWLNWVEIEGRITSRLNSLKRIVVMEMLTTVWMQSKIICVFLELINS